MARGGNSSCRCCNAERDRGDAQMKLNKLVNADAQGRPVAPRPPLLGRGLHAR